MSKMNSTAEDWQEYFDSQAYLNTFYGRDMFTRPDRFLRDYLSQITENMHRIMATGTYSGQKLLDFGCGSVIQNAISPSRCFQEIYFADFETNLDQIKKWINRSPDAFDWSHFFKHYAELEGKNASNLENRLRSKIKGTIPYSKSLLDSEPLDADLEGEFDFVMANNCLLVICGTIGDYAECLKKLKRYIRPEGHLLVTETLKETQSLIGSERFKMFPLQYDDVIKCFIEAGFIIMETMQINFNNTESVFCDSNTGHFSLLKKPY